MKYFFSFLILGLLACSGQALALNEGGSTGTPFPSTSNAERSAPSGEAQQSGFSGGAQRSTFSGESGGGGGVGLKNPLMAKSIQQLFQAIIDIVLVFAVPIIVFFIIYAGFLYVTARGNEETIKKAHMALLYALLGGLLILGARVLIEVVGGTVDAIR